MKLVIDVETNGFLDILDTVHCIVCKDIETQKVYEFNPDNLDAGLQLIKKATLLIGHSILGFDIKLSPSCTNINPFEFLP